MSETNIHDFTDIPNEVRCFKCGKTLKLGDFPVVDALCDKCMGLAHTTTSTCHVIKEYGWRYNQEIQERNRKLWEEADSKQRIRQVRRPRSFLGFKFGGR